MDVDPAHRSVRTDRTDSSSSSNGSDSSNSSGSSTNSPASIGLSELTLDGRLAVDEPEWVGPWALIHGSAGSPSRQPNLLGWRPGRVHRAVHIDTGETVALLLARSHAPAQMAALRREARALASCDHPGIVRLRGRGSADGLPYLATELIEGPSLADMIAWIGRPPGELAPPSLPAELGALLRTLSRVCDALAHLHGRGLVLRGLHPGRIVIASAERPVLADLGYAEFGPIAASLVPHTDVHGPYRAPEQILGDAVDARADLFALGCIIYQLALGRPPTVASPEGAVALGLHLARRRESGPPAQTLDALTNAVPSELERLVRALLAREPSERPRHARDVEPILARVAAGLPGTHAAIVRPRSLSAREPVLCAPGTVDRGDHRRAATELVERLVERLGTASRGGRLTFVGPGGSGKSHMLAWVARALRTEQHAAIVVRGRPSPRPSSAGRGGADSHAGPPLGPLRPWLRQLARQLRASPSERRRRILGPRRERAAVLAHIEPALGKLLGSGPTPVALPAEGERQRLLACARDLALALADERPLAILVEDLQWVDPLTADWLRAIDAERRVGAPVALVAASLDGGPSPLPEWLEPPSSARSLTRGFALTMTPLSDARAAELIAAALACPRAPADVLERFEAEAGPDMRGRAGFVLAWLRARLDDGRLIDVGGRWQWAARRGPLAPLEEPRPRTLSDLLDATIDSLADDTLEFLGLLALFGLRAPLARLLVVEPRSEWALTRILGQAIGSRLVVEDVDGVIAFVDAVARARTLARLPDRTRGRLHHNVAAAAASDPEFADWLGPAELAEHLELGGLTLRAARAHRRTGELALRTGASELAIVAFSRALELSADAEGEQLDSPLTPIPWRESSLLREEPEAPAAAVRMPHAIAPDATGPTFEDPTPALDEGADADAIVHSRGRERAGGHPSAAAESPTEPNPQARERTGERAWERIPTQPSLELPDDLPDAPVFNPEAEGGAIPSLLQRQPSCGWREFELEPGELEAHLERLHEPGYAEGVATARDRVESGSGPHPSSLRFDPIPDAHARPPSLANQRTHLHRRRIESLLLAGDHAAAEDALCDGLRELGEPGGRARGRATRATWVFALPTILAAARRRHGRKLAANEDPETVLLASALHRELAELALDRGDARTAAAATRRALACARAVEARSLELFAAEASAIRLASHAGWPRLADRLASRLRPLDSLDPLDPDDRGAPDHPEAPLGERAHLHHLQARHDLGRGRWRASHEHALAAADMFARLGHTVREQACRIQIAFAAIARGESSIAEDPITLAERAAEATGDRLGAMWSGLARLAMLLGLDDVDERADEVAARCLRGLPLVRDPAERVLALGLLGRLAHTRGERATARARAREALRACERARLGAIQTTFGLVPAAELLLALDEDPPVSSIDRALETWARPLAIADPGRRRIAARVAIVRDRPGRARRLARAAATIATQLGMPLERARAEALLSELRGARTRG